jgi:anti-sigma regulatory factor (Ser/Thr protein kinase)
MGRRRTDTRGGDAALSLVLRAAPDAGGRVRAGLAEVPCGLCPRRLREALVAVTEAVNNACLHAYGPDGGTVEVRAWARGGGLVVLVVDHGAGFAVGSGTRGRHTGLGFGLRLMDDLCTRLLVESRPGRTAVTMGFDP